MSSQETSSTKPEPLPDYRTVYARLLRKARASGYRFDRAAANRVVVFFEVFLCHVKGKWARKPFILMPWQRKLLRTLFGWKQPDGLRTFRTLFLEVPRKNGKSELCAGIALYLLFGDDEEAAEIYSGAADEAQANIVFGMAKRMRALSPEIERRTGASKKAVFHAKSASTYQVISSIGETKHGFSPHGNVIDELHAHKNRDLWDALTSATGAREQPLTVAITTAGTDRTSICYEQLEYAEKILRGTIESLDFLGVIFSASEDDDWADPKVWAKANPSLGVTIKPEYLAAECKKAQDTPALQNTFMRLHLNIWTRQVTRAISMKVWDASAGEVDENALAGLRCGGGLDLASSKDVAAWVMCFPVGDDYKFVHRFFIPEDTIEERSRIDRVPYAAWKRMGLVIATPGNSIDYAKIREQVLADAKVFRILDIGFDRWGAIQITQELAEEGIEVVPFGQGFASMAAPTKELLELLLKRRAHHGGHPVQRWMANNLALAEDAAGNLKPDKKRSREKIDGIPAAVMALDRAIRNLNKKTSSVYERRGLTVLGGGQPK